MRERIGALANGTYVYEDYLEYFDDGRFDPVLMRWALTVGDQHVIADFAGSNEQVPGVVNSPMVSFPWINWHRAPEGSLLTSTSCVRPSKIDAQDEPIVIFEDVQLGFPACRGDRLGASGTRVA